MLNLPSRLYLLFICVGVYYSVSLKRSSHVSALSDKSDFSAAKRRLLHKLTNHSPIMKEILPVENPSSALKLEMELVLRQIATVDEVNQAVRLNMWFRLFWNNPFLQWDPEDYAGIKSVHLDSNLFWTPDLALFNKASLEEDIDILYKRMITNLIINSTGGCTWLNPVTILAQCHIKVARFPFDEQDCSVTLGSWTHNQNEIDPINKADEAELNHLIPNGEWEVLSAKLEKNVRSYGGFFYPDITMRLRMKRLPLYYALNLIIPCALIALLSFSSFILPSDHGERVSLVITVLLANSVYMLIVSTSLPQTSDAVPIIVVYFLSVIIEIAMCLFATCLTMKICAKKTKMPDWVESMVNQRLARLVFLEPVANTKQARDLAIVSNETFRKVSERERYASAEKMNGVGSNAELGEVELLEVGFQSSSKEGSSQDIRGRFISEICCLTDEVRLRQAREFAAKKWRRTAKVLDRFFLFFFLFVYLILTGYLLGSM